MPQDPVRVHVDASAWSGPLPHNWTYIGYDENNYTYVPEGVELLRKFGQVQKQPTYVRAHHLLCTGNCHAFYKWGSTNAYLEDEDGNPIYDWTFVDLVFDTLLQTGCKPSLRTDGASRTGPGEQRRPRSSRLGCTQHRP
jgi:xylan 1,4-beta-xylosidase